MILTSCYREIDEKKYKDQIYSISGDRGRAVDYKGKCYPALAPKRDFWEVWHSNIGKISERENAKYYIDKYYEEVLSKLDVNKVYKELDESILLCYEDARAFCHRHIVAAWFELMLGVRVPEVKIKNGSLVEAPRGNFIKNYLEEVIKSNVDMKGFNTLYSLNLYNRSKMLEAHAKNNSDIELSRYLDNLAFESDEIVKTKTL